MKRILYALLGFLTGAWLVDQYIIATREPFDPDNCDEYLETKYPTVTPAPEYSDPEQSIDDYLKWLLSK